MQETRFAVIDTETTGLDTKQDRVVSLAVVPVDSGRLRREQAIEILVDPGMPIPPESTCIHGITDADVAGAPSLAAALQQAAPAMADRVIAGHNVEFDLAFLRRVGYAAGQSLDTLAVSRLLWAQRGTRHNLDEFTARLGITPEDRHTALGDAIATAEALVASMPLLEARGLQEPDDVARAYRAQRVARGRVRRSIRRRSIRRHRTVQGFRRSAQPRSEHRRR